MSRGGAGCGGEEMDKWRCGLKWRWESGLVGRVRLISGDGAGKWKWAGLESHYGRGVGKWRWDW